VAFGFYVAGMVLGQTIVDKYILKNFKKDGKQILVVLIGIPLVLAIYFALFLFVFS
jgi:hypothetical protein